MNLFQEIALPIIALLLIYSVISVLRGRATRKEGFLWVLVWLATGVAIAWPGITQKLAHLLGIRRGADLVLYCAVVVMLIGFLVVYVRMRHLQREITLLVRHVAIRDAGRNSPTDEQQAAQDVSSEQTTSEPAD
ncbi:MAG: DUF2304 domain-containing protein [Phycisphaerae bacterium]|jgi:hypothetical protein